MKNSTGTTSTLGKSKWSVALVCCLILGSFANPGFSQTPHRDWAKQQFIAKAAKVLLAEDFELPPSEMQRLLQLSKEDIFADLVSREAFRNRSLEFANYYLGLPQTLITTRYLYSEFKDSPIETIKVFNTNNLATYVFYKTLEAGNDPLSFFRQSLIPLASISSTPYLDRSDIPGGDPANITRAQARDIIRDNSIGKIDQLLQQVQSMPAQEAGALICNSLFDLVVFDSYGVDFEASQIVGLPIFSIFGTCNQPFNADSIVSLATALTEAKAIHVDIARFANDHDYPSYHPQAIDEVEEVDFSRYPALRNNAELFNFQQWFENLANSSTNYNRRRAAFVLEKFLCDDLTPIDIIAPDPSKPGHGSKGHGSDPSCQACHYKLDPMAGMFRNYGINGTYMPDGKQFVFDDNKFIHGPEITRYWETWQDPAAPNGWNIGYVRSTNDLSKNDYADPDAPQLTELTRIIGNAPEARSCFVRRMADYFIDQEQIFDGAWLAQVEAKLQQPTAGFVGALKQLILSNTFAQNNRDPQICYDMVDPSSKIPCTVRHLITKNCASCHNTNDFDFSDDTFRSNVIDRITTADRQRRMPLNKEMSDQSRAKLLKWLKSYP